MTKGLLRGIEDGWFMSEIAEAAFQYQVALEKGDKKIVGVNCTPTSVTHDLEILRVSHEVEVEQVRVLGRAPDRRATRPRSRAAVDADGRGRAHRRQHDPGDARGRAAPRPPWARSATRCAPSGASTASRRASEPDSSASRQRGRVA